MKREREAAAAAARSKADLVEGWLEDAAVALLERRFTEPGPEDVTTERGSADGHEYEEWHLGLEGLVARGRTAVQEAVESGAVDAGAAARVEYSREELERILSREKAYIADPADPFRPGSRDATVEGGRRIAAEPALPDELRRDVEEIVNGHDAREAAVNAARPWLLAWERFERTFPDENAARDAPDAPGRIERARSLLDTPGLPEWHRTRIGSIVRGFDERRSEPGEGRTAVDRSGSGRGRGRGAARSRPRRGPMDHCRRPSQVFEHSP